MKRKIAHFLSLFLVVLYFVIDGFTYMSTGKPTLQVFAFLAALMSLIAVLTDSDNQI